MKTLVITPTTGAPELTDAIESVITQTYKDVDHLIVVDGFDFSSRVDRTLSDGGIVFGDRINRVDLPYNTGGGGFYGHRIMAAFSHLVNHDLVFFLDQDNWFDPDHVATLVQEITQYNLDWAYSLRKIYNKDKQYVCDDNCESLGRWPVWVDEISHLIDSSSYCFKTSFLRQVGHVWDYGWGADRRFYTILKDHFKHQNYTCTGKHTLCYRLGGNEGSVTGEFFVEGNRKVQEKYNGKFPWLENR
jgi:hypothetical protein